MSIQRKSTEKIELVETHNLALSLRRLRDIPDTYDDMPARSALYHAVCMFSIFREEDRMKLREALRLP